MDRRAPKPQRAEYLPHALFGHPAWAAWKASMGWSRLSPPGTSCMFARRLGSIGSMAYARCSPAMLGSDSGDGDDPDYGAALEELSLRARDGLPRDCVFLRWDLMAPAWTDGRGQSLALPFQELRMNASTRLRRFRKAAREQNCTETMLVDLGGGPGAVHARVDADARYEVRLAGRRGTRAARAGRERLGDFHALHRKTAAHRGLPVHPRRAFESLLGAADGEIQLDLYLAENEGESVAAAIFARSARESWYLFAASAPERRGASGPSALLHRALMDYAAAGVERMDLLGVAPAGGSDHPLAGITRFKAGFGGERRSRAGAWDFVLQPEAYERYARAEALAASIGRALPMRDGAPT